MILVVALKNVEAAYTAIEGQRWVGEDERKERGFSIVSSSRPRSEEGIHR